jgi:hypothetical protein
MRELLLGMSQVLSFAASERISSLGARGAGYELVSAIPVLGDARLWVLGRRFHRGHLGDSIRFLFLAPERMSSRCARAPGGYEVVCASQAWVTVFSACSAGD